MWILFEFVGLVVKCSYNYVKAVYRYVMPPRWLGFKDVSGQLVLITGAGSGIGRMLAVKFAERGSNLVLWDINEEWNAETARLVREKGVRAYTYILDLSLREKIYETADKVKQEAGDVDILINNAGIVSGRMLLDCPDELIQKTMDVNINAHFWTVKSFLPAMLAKGRGHVVTVASSAGLFGVRYLVDYCASKFAAVGFDEALRNELWGSGRRNIKTTVVCPYIVNTGLFQGAYTRFPLFMPILQPEFVADRMMEAILTDRLMLITPTTVDLTSTIRTMIPYEVAFALGDFFGTNKMMDTFVGRHKSK